MICSFPTSVASTDEWLAALNMQRYSTAFTDVPVAQLSEITDAHLHKLGVTKVGHRKRLLIGASHLAKSTTSAEEAPCANVVDGGEVIIGDEPRDEQTMMIHNAEHAATTAMLQEMVLGGTAHSDGSTSYAKSMASGSAGSEWEVLERIEEDEAVSSRRPTEPIKDMIRRRLSLRIAALLALGWTLALPRILPFVSPSSTERFSAIPSSFLGLMGYSTAALTGASYWRLDSALRRGLGRRFFTAAYGGAALFVAAVFKETWSAMRKAGPERSAQVFIYDCSGTLVLATSVTAFLSASNSCLSWWLIRFHTAFPPAIAAAALIAESILLWDGDLRRLSTQPARWCFHPQCRMSETMGEAWISQCMCTLGMWLLCVLLSPANRRRAAGRTGLAHVRLNLGDICGLPEHIAVGVGSCGGSEAGRTSDGSRGGCPVGGLP
jgi:hypothetical protein